MSLQGKVFKLSNGQTIPAVAYGAGTKWFKWGNSEISEPAVNAMKYALGHGFNHIDGALIYGTDQEIGSVLSTVDRSSVYVTNKYFATVGEMKTPYENPYVSLTKQLQDLKTDYVDLYLLHHPVVSKEANGHDLKEMWEFMEQIVDDGLAKAIGVSNFAVDDVKTVLETARIKPVVNQIEFSAYLQNQSPGIVDYCQKNDILVAAYSPLSPLFQNKRGKLHEFIDEVASKYEKTPGQVLLRWVLQKGVLPVTTSSNETRIAQLSDLFSFELTDEEFNQISEIGESHPNFRIYWKEIYGQYD